MFIAYILVIASSFSLISLTFYSLYFLLAKHFSFFFKFFKVGDWTVAQATLQNLFEALKYFTLSGFGNDPILKNCLAYFEVLFYTCSTPQMANAILQNFAFKIWTYGR